MDDLKSVTWRNGNCPACKDTGLLSDLPPQHAFHGWFCFCAAGGLLNAKATVPLLDALFGRKSVSH